MDRIEVTVRARDDADEEFAWLAAKVSPEFAATWYGGLFEQIDTLMHFPARSRASRPNSPGRFGS